MTFLLNIDVPDIAQATSFYTAAFGLTVTLVWLYVEIIRLLAILRGDD